MILKATLSFFDPACSWLSNLQHILDLSIDKFFNTSQLFSCLKLLPHLKNLGLSGKRCEEVALNPFFNGPVHLPNLRTLRLHGNINFLSPMLQNLVPAHGCLLWIWSKLCHWRQAEYTDEAVFSFGKALTTFLRNCPPRNFQVLDYQLHKPQFLIGNKDLSYYVVFDKVLSPINKHIWERVVCEVSSAFTCNSISSTLTLNLVLQFLPASSVAILDFLNLFT